MSKTLENFSSAVVDNSPQAGTARMERGWKAASCSILPGYSTWEEGKFLPPTLCLWSNLQHMGQSHLGPGDDISYHTQQWSQTVRSAHHLHRFQPGTLFSYCSKKENVKHPTSSYSERYYLVQYYSPYSNQLKNFLFYLLHTFPLAPFLFKRSAQTILPTVSLWHYAA